MQKTMAKNATETRTKNSDYNTCRHTADDEVVSQCPGTVPVLFQVPQGKPVANFHRLNW